MTDSATDPGLASALADTLDELHRALFRATEVAAALRRIVLRAPIDDGDATRPARSAAQTTAPLAPQSEPHPPDAEDGAPRLRLIPRHSEPPPRPRHRAPAPADDLPCVRLEIESTRSALDLRAIDEALREDEAVHDIALLNYDGRRVTLKVWTGDSANAEQAADALIGHIERKLSPDARLRIVALAEAA